ncbi:MAG: hypothetical protein ACI8RD_012180 [Bacillariaceae sp.]|jgi:hypothetical protein
MADFGRSFLDMAEAMLGKSSSYIRSSSCDVLKSSSSELNGNNKSNADGGEAGSKKRALSSVLKEKCLTTNNNDTSTISTCNGSSKSNPNPRDNVRPIIDSPSPDSKISERRRSVDFQMPSKQKRQRITAGNYSATDIVQALNCAMSPEERKEALENAM